MAGLSLNVLIAAGVLLTLVVAFGAAFLGPGLLLWWRLSTLLQRMARFDARTPLAEFRKLFGADRRLAHLWREYQDTLHLLPGAPAEPLPDSRFLEEPGAGLRAKAAAPPPPAARSTVAAETFFNREGVVDSRLRTEFFKHLPGLFTGVGIIGTFSGLITGLRQFQVSDNAANVRASLEGLMHAVGEAFLISAAAITAAMVVTLLEKLLLASLYRQAEAITHRIDACFASTAGEDYLARLLQLSEDSARSSPAQAQRLKDELVRELGDNLGRQVGAAVAASLEKSLAAPLQALAEQLQRGSQAPAAAAQQAAAAQVQSTQRLEAVVAAFSQRLQDLLSGQASGNDLSRQHAAQTQQEMRAVVAQMNLSVQALGHATHESLDKMAGGADRLARASADFAAAGERVGAVMGQAAALAGQLQAATATLAEGVTAMQAGLTEHRAEREAMAALVAELGQLLAAARKEAGFSSEVLARLEAASQRLGAAQQQADHYLAGVSQVLGEAHQAFASSVRKTLDVSNAEFQSQLSTAVGLLAATLRELEATLGDALPAKAG